MEKIPAITVFDQNILSEYFIYLASKELNNTQRYYQIWWYDQKCSINLSVCIKTDLPRKISRNIRIHDQISGK